MSDTKRISAEYRITCVSVVKNGEDYDYKTIIHDNLCQEEALFIESIAKLLKMNGTGLENVYEPSQAEIEHGYKVLLPFFKENSNLFDHDFIKEIEEDGYQMIKYIREYLLGHTGGYYLRELESIKIEHISHDVIIDDVSLLSKGFF